MLILPFSSAIKPMAILAFVFPAFTSAVIRTPFPKAQAKLLDRVVRQRWAARRDREEMVEAKG